MTRGLVRFVLLGVGALSIAVAAQRDGDTWVVFPSLRVAHAGDMFADKGPPVIDASNGGSIVEHAATIAKAATFGIEGDVRQAYTGLKK